MLVDDNLATHRRAFGRILAGVVEKCVAAEDHALVEDEDAAALALTAVAELDVDGIEAVSHGLSHGLEPVQLSF